MKALGDARGLTLVELVVTVAIVTTLAAIGSPTYQNLTAAAKIARAKADIRIISGEIDVLNLASGRYPKTLAEVGRGTFLDPWDHPYQYLNIANDHPPRGQMRKDRFLVPINSDYDLYSMGPDGKSVSPLTAAGSRDDIIRANNGGYIGLAAGY